MRGAEFEGFFRGARLRFRKPHETGVAQPSLTVGRLRSPIGVSVNGAAVLRLYVQDLFESVKTSIIHAISGVLGQLFKHKTRILALAQRAAGMTN